MIHAEQRETVKRRKEEIRKEMIRRLRDHDPSERKERSLAIQKKLLGSAEFMEAATVLAYVSLPTEVSTEDIIREAMDRGKRVGVPYMTSGSARMAVSEIKIDQCLERGPCGIYQPSGADLKAIPLKEIDLVIVPAIAYDLNNMRLGRGKGYYDMFLSGGDISQAKTIGIVFGFQQVRILPSSPHDRPVDRVITDQDLQD